LTPQIRQWSKKYRLIKDNICQPLSYENTSAKFFEAITIYEPNLEKFKENNKKEDKLDKSFKILKDAKACRTKK
jgi:hypothetical protein